MRGRDTSTRARRGDSTPGARGLAPWAQALYERMDAAVQAPDAERDARHARLRAMEDACHAAEVEAP